MLKLDSVSKFYSLNGVVTAGFSKVSLDLNIGEFVAITGESGSGKSTLLNVISGLDSFEEGEMYIFGQPTSGYSSDDMEDYRKRYIGNIFQTFNLINHYTVYQNVEMVLLLSGFDEAEIKARVDAIIDRVGLSEYRNTKASKLSGGQKQRVAIARALAKETPIIVADEPTGNLDVQSAADIIKLLASIAEDKLIIIVTHNYEQVEPYVTRKISMHDGRIAEDKVLRAAPAAAGAGAASSDAARPQAAARPSADASVKPEASGTRIPSLRPMPAKADDLTKKNTLRLGARNAFSLPAKLLLLFFVFVFLTIGTFASYSAYIGMRDGTSSNSWGFIFDNVTPERVLITKPLTTHGDGSFVSSDATHGDGSFVSYDDTKEPSPAADTPTHGPAASFDVLTDEDAAKISALDNVAYVMKSDILMDAVFTFSDDPTPSSYLNYEDDGYSAEYIEVVHENGEIETIMEGADYREVSYWIDAKATSIDFLKTQTEGDLPEESLVMGRLPKNEMEAVLVIREDSFIAENKLQEVFNHTSYIDCNQSMLPADGLNTPVEIVGIAYFTEEPNFANGRYYDSFLVMTDAGLKRLERIVSLSSAMTELKVEDDILSVGYTQYDDVWLFADENVAPGTVLFPAALLATEGDDTKEPSPTSNDEADDTKEPSPTSASSTDATASSTTNTTEPSLKYDMPSSVTLRTRKSAYDRTLDLAVTGVTDDGIRMHVNPDDLWSLYEPTELRQMSAVLKSSLYQAETRAEIEALGYSTLYLNQTADKQSMIEKIILRVLRIVILVFLLGVLFFVIYFIIKLIMKSQNVYYSTVRMLGGSRDACSGTLLSELLVVFHIAFILCLAVIIKIRVAGSFILGPYLVRLIRYITTTDYIILYIVVLIMTILLARRYSSQMFKKTAMNAYREEV